MEKARASSLYLKTMPQWIRCAFKKPEADEVAQGPILVFVVVLCDTFHLFIRSLSSKAFTSSFGIKHKHNAMFASSMM